MIDLPISMREVQEEYLVHPALPVRHNAGGPPGDSGDDHGGGDGNDESEEDTPIHSDDGARPPRKPDGDPNPDGPHDRRSRMNHSLTDEPFFDDQQMG